MLYSKLFISSHDLGFRRYAALYIRKMVFLKINANHRLHIFNKAV